MTEKEIIKLCKIKDPKGQKLFYDQFSTQMFKVCYRYVRNELDAEDLVISGFLKVFQNIERFELREKSNVAAWVKKIMVNESLMYLRSKNNFQMVADTYAEKLNTDMSPLEKLASEDLYQIITQLPTGYRTVFNLFVIEGYSHKEIANQLGINENTSKSQLSKAKGMLRGFIDKYDMRYGS